MPRLVSILIPAYNAESWLAETLRSALRQDWPRREIVVVDDGSRDRTLEIAREFSAKDVLVVTQTNQGAAAARNRAFSECQGQYIQWLDADDLLSPDKISKQMRVVDREQCGPRTLLSSRWGRFMHRPQCAEFEPSQLWSDLSPVEWLRLKMSYNLHMQTATWLVSREVTEAAGAWDVDLATDDDGEYFCRVLLNSGNVRFVSGGAVLYRRTGSQRVSHIGRSGRKMDAQFRSMRLHIGYLLSMENSQRTRESCVQYLQNWLLHFYPERPDIVGEARNLAADLGGDLRTPTLSWKYEWIRRLLGWRMAKTAQVLLPEAKWAVARRWDELLYSLNG